MYPVQSDLRSALQIAATFCYLNQIPLSAWPESRIALCRRTKVRAESLRLKLRSRVRAFSSSPSSIESEALVDKTIQPAICTADELHYVSAPNSDWRLALWRYIPSPKAPSRNHPLLLLSGVGTNAIGYDLSPGSSFARYMSSQGFDTWILEVRGAGLSMRGVESKKTDLSSENNVISNPIVSTTKGTINSVLPAEQEPAINLGSLVDFENSAVKENNKESVTVWDESQVVAKLTETFMSLSERVSGFLNEGQSRIMSAKLFDQISKLLEDAQLSERFDEIREKLSGLLEARQNSAIASQIRDLSQRLVNIIEEGQRSVSPQFFDLQERFSTTIEDFQKQLDLIIKYDWDFDNYLEEDVPTAMEYIRAQSKPKDGKLLAIGHSMGGILLYAMLSQSGFSGSQYQSKSRALSPHVLLGSSSSGHLSIEQPPSKFYQRPSLSQTTNCNVQAFSNQHQALREETLDWLQLLLWHHHLITLLPSHHSSYSYPLQILLRHLMFLLYLWGHYWQLLIPFLVVLLMCCLGLMLRSQLRT
ncbi:PREDICTED: uncharacterized protein LOC104613301 isoform X2 [Nelumbo nucifera]|uniref:Uncharacterized protein LOC104613301 isoform X2 n=1 Tax=Nelumbo nucifera TaxID=4432 RepID=A0A1U8QB51_NELNU|nr:PREDICTED: uncharacterized protein LOC104613301 isoform X2 [Nelumbo nucifera]XP_019056020.1 PREDICTED: uncharacterized protein LOC104613301 isoform X2 [Nelumbo nucifera]